MSIAHKFKDKIRTNDVLISESVDFSGLLLSDHVLRGLTGAGFKRPSPIQLKAIPLGRCGLDLIVQAKSGTGKTCVFTVVALEALEIESVCVQVLVLAPTREIAIQIQDVIHGIGEAMIGLKCHTFIGGLPLQQDKLLARSCHIAVGTPGRVKQLIELEALKTSSVRLFVLDEADMLLEESFQETINWIYSMLPANKQILALSATYPEYLAQHLTAYMRNPTFVRLNITDPALLGVKQYHVIVPSHPMPNVVYNSKTEAVVKILSSISFQQCLIFSNMQTRAQNLQYELQSRNWPTVCIAGCLDQTERNFAMQQLKTYKCRILISTDLTSRGIDADKVNLIINLDVPPDHETYLHRIGRAGRFGSFGVAITIVTKGSEEAELWKVEKKCSTYICKLPDPVPNDLVTRPIPVRIDDIVSTQQIINQPTQEARAFSILPEAPQKNLFKDQAVLGHRELQNLSDDEHLVDGEMEITRKYACLTIEGAEGFGADTSVQVNAEAGSEMVADIIKTQCNGFVPACTSSVETFEKSQILVKHVHAELQQNGATKDLNHDLDLESHESGCKASQSFNSEKLKSSTCKKMYGQEDDVCAYQKCGWGVSNSQCEKDMTPSLGEVSQYTADLSKSVSLMLSSHGCLEPCESQQSKISVLQQNSLLLAADSSLPQDVASVLQDSIVVTPSSDLSQPPPDVSVLPSDISKLPPELAVPPSVSKLNEDSLLNNMSVSPCDLSMSGSQPDESMPPSTLHVLYDLARPHSTKTTSCIDTEARLSKERLEVIYQQYIDTSIMKKAVNSINSKSQNIGLHEYQDNGKPVMDNSANNCEAGATCSLEENMTLSGTENSLALQESVVNASNRENTMLVKESLVSASNRENTIRVEESLVNGYKYSNKEKIPPALELLNNSKSSNREKTTFVQGLVVNASKPNNKEKTPTVQESVLNTGKSNNRNYILPNDTHTDMMKSEEKHNLMVNGHLNQDYAYRQADDVNNSSTIKKKSRVYDKNDDDECKMLDDMHAQMLAKRRLKKLENLKNGYAGMQQSKGSVGSKQIGSNPLKDVDLYADSISRDILCDATVSASLNVKTGFGYFTAGNKGGIDKVLDIVNTECGTTKLATKAAGDTQCVRQIDALHGSAELCGVSENVNTECSAIKSATKVACDTQCVPQIDPAHGGDIRGKLSSPVEESPNDKIIPKDHLLLVKEPFSNETHLDNKSKTLDTQKVHVTNSSLVQETAKPSTTKRIYRREMCPRSFVVSDFLQGFSEDMSMIPGSPPSLDLIAGGDSIKVPWKPHTDELKRAYDAPDTGNTTNEASIEVDSGGSVSQNVTRKGSGSDETEAAKSPSCPEMRQLSDPNGHSENSLSSAVGDETSHKGATCLNEPLTTAVNSDVGSMFRELVKPSRELLASSVRSLLLPSLHKSQHTTLASLEADYQHFSTDFMEGSEIEHSVLNMMNSLVIEDFVDPEDIQKLCALEASKLGALKSQIHQKLITAEDDRKISAEIRSKQKLEDDCKFLKKDNGTTELEERRNSDSPCNSDDQTPFWKKNKKWSKMKSKENKKAQRSDNPNWRSGEFEQKHENSCQEETEKEISFSPWKSSKRAHLYQKNKDLCSESYKDTQPQVYNGECSDHDSLKSSVTTTQEKAVCLFQGPALDASKHNNIKDIQQEQKPVMDADKCSIKEHQNCGKEAQKELTPDNEERCVEGKSSKYGHRLGEESYENEHRFSADSHKSKSASELRSHSHDISKHSPIQSHRSSESYENKHILCEEQSGNEHGLSEETCKNEHKLTVDSYKNNSDRALVSHSHDISNLPTESHWSSKESYKNEHKLIIDSYESNSDRALDSHLHDISNNSPVQSPFTHKSYQETGKGKNFFPIKKEVYKKLIQNRERCVEGKSRRYSHMWSEELCENKHRLREELYVNKHGLSEESYMNKHRFTVNSHESESDSELDSHSHDIPIHPIKSPFIHQGCLPLHNVNFPGFGSYINTPQDYWSQPSLSVPLSALQYGYHSGPYYPASHPWSAAHFPHYSLSSHSLPHPSYPYILPTHHPSYPHRAPPHNHHHPQFLNQPTPYPPPLFSDPILTTWYTSHMTKMLHQLHRKHRKAKQVWKD